MAPKLRSTRIVSPLLLLALTGLAAAADEPKHAQPPACAATVGFEYQQRNTTAHVTGAIQNTQCAASGGDYVLTVTIRDAKGEVSTLEFPQEWARSDAESVKLTFDLPIGPNVDLTSVRTRRLRCTCTEPAERP